MANSETADYDVAMPDSESFEHREECGGKDTAERAFDRWNALRNAHEAPPNDPGLDEAPREFVTRKKLSMPDAWY